MPLKEDIEILNDGGKLLRYAERIIDSRSPKLWRSFERICLTHSLIRVEALYEAVGMLPDYVECKVFMENVGKTYTLVDHLERCISTWIYYRKSSENFPEELENTKRIFIYYTQEGKIKATYLENVYPVYTTPEVTIVRAERLRLCARCRNKMSMDSYGYFYCPECGSNDR
jgi:hypothetical protein